MNFKQTIERVDADARELRPHLLVLTVITAVLFAAGWIVGQVSRGIWLVVAWMWAAAVVGFKSANGRGDT